MRRNAFSIDDFDFEAVEEAPTDPLSELQDHLGPASAMDPSEFLKDTTLLVPASALYYFRSSPAWAVRVDAPGEQEAKAKGKRVFRALKGKRSVASHVPHVHDLPLYVIYGDSWARVGPSATKPLSSVGRSKADQKREIVAKGERTFGSRSIRITGSDGAYQLHIQPTRKELRVFKDATASATSLQGIDAKLDEAVAAVEAWRARNPGTLPEDPWRYFTHPHDAVLIPISALQPIRARPTGIENAKKHMLAAYEGRGARRKPISVSSDGRVLDGNSTYAVAKESGWSSIPAVITDEDAVHNPRFKNARASVTRADYPAVFGDTDSDALPDVDDPRPRIPGDRQSIEEVLLSDEIGALIDARDHYVPAMQRVIDSLNGLHIHGATVQGRVKTPYSMINKLRRKRLKTLTDVAGTRIVVPDQKALRRVTQMIESDFEVVEKEDFYETPQAGYRAIHYIVRSDGVPVEIQVKTRRMSDISEASHTAYKRGELDADAMERLTSLAAKADAGNRRAAEEIDPVLRSSAQLRRALTRQLNPSERRISRMLARGGR